MVQTNKLNFIVIDDSKLDCFIAEKIIKNTGKSETIKSFLQATEDTFPEIKKSSQAEFGELQIRESGATAESGRVVPSGIYVRFVR